MTQDLTETERDLEAEIEEKDLLLTAQAAALMLGSDESH